MPLSVRVRLAYCHSCTPTVTIHVHVDGQDGVSAPINYPTLWGAEHLVLLSPPNGTGLKTPAKEIKRRSARQERTRIEAIGGRSHAGSGSKSGYKSDGSTDRWRMENKFTGANSYRVTLADLAKLRSECRNAQAPVFNVEFQDKHTGAVKETWVLVPATEWEKLVHAREYQ
jgi:hypothetical protein